MAIGKSIKMKSHAIATYHRISRVFINWLAQTAQTTVVNHLNLEARMDPEAGALGHDDFSYNGDAFPFTDIQQQTLRSALGLGTNEKLIHVQVSFHGPKVAINAQCERTVFGETKQYSIDTMADKAAFPSVYIDTMYELVTETEKYGDGEEV